MTESHDVTYPGLGVDIHGAPVVDPTKNVIDKVDSEVRRLDDIAELREKYGNEKLQLRMMYEDKINMLRADLTEKLANKETDRLDSIRAVDQSTVQQRATVQEQQVQALAKAASESAETLRKQVETTAQASDTKNDAKFAEITRALAALQEAQFRTAGGKEQVVEAHASNANVGIIIGAIGAVFAIIFAVIALYLGLHNNNNNSSNSSVNTDALTQVATNTLRLTRIEDQLNTIVAKLPSK